MFCGSSSGPSGSWPTSSRRRTDRSSPGRSRGITAAGHKRLRLPAVNGSCRHPSPVPRRVMPAKQALVQLGGVRSRARRPRDPGLRSAHFRLERHRGQDSDRGRLDRRQPCPGTARARQRGRVGAGVGALSDRAREHTRPAVRRSSLPWVGSACAEYPPPRGWQSQPRSF